MIGDVEDRLTFFLVVAEDTEELRTRIREKLDLLPIEDRREWTDKRFSRLIYHLREAQLAALKLGGAELKRAGGFRVHRKAAS